MARILKDIGREFKRVRQSSQEKLQLARAGFQHVLSSNVSAIAKSGKDLVVRFHGGATYQYSGAGDLFSAMLKSSSKGHFVFIKLIKPQVPFKKVGSVNLKSDEQFTDRDLTQEPRIKLTVPSLLSTLISKEQLIQKGIIATNLASLIKGT
jgi:hypothetical protein